MRADWLRQIDSTAGDIDPNALWQALQHYLGLVFRQHGVEAVQLLDASASGSPNEAALASMLEQVIQKADLVDHQSAVKQGIAAFFRDTGPARLRYMSELLDGAFTFFALTVGDATAEYLKSQLPPLRLFLDTNVVLGVLGLHDNPLQATCDELLATIENGHYPFQLYCHERTLRELSEISDADKARLSTKRYSPQLSKAYVQWGETHNEFGVEMRFHRLNAAGEIDVAAFLARFDHIEELLAAKKIKIYRQAGPDLDTSPATSVIFQERPASRSPCALSRPGTALLRQELPHESIGCQRSSHGSSATAFAASAQTTEPEQSRL